MGRLRVKRVSQPQGVVGSDAGNPLNQSLALLEQLHTSISVKVGTTLTVGRSGAARGFGATVGAGSTDSVETTLTKHATQRSYFVLLRRDGAGASNFSRVWDKRKSGVQVDDLFSDSSANNWMQFDRAWSGGGGSWTFPQIPVGIDTGILISYDSGSTLNVPDIWVNGIRQTVTQTVAPVGSALTNTDPYVLGNRKNDNARNWNGLIYTFAVWDRLSTAHDALSLAQNPQQLTAKIARNSYQAAAAGGGSIIPTGQTATATSGTTTPSLSLSTSGNSATGSAGSVTAGLSIAVTGRTATATQGSVTPSLTIALTGSSATAAAGTVSASTPGAISLTGSAATATQGAVVPSLSKAITGNSSTATAGALVPAVSLGLTGQTATGSQGALVAALSLGISGQASTASSGIISAPSGDLTVALLGNSLAVSAGVVSIPSSAAGGYDDKKKTKKQIKQQVQRLNEQIVESLQSEVIEEIKAVAPVTKAFVQSLVSAQAIQQIDDEDEDEALMLLMM